MRIKVVNTLVDSPVTFRVLATNDGGQLGDGTLVQRATPLRVATRTSIDLVAFGRMPHA